MTTYTPTTATVRARYHLATVPDTASQSYIDASRDRLYAEFDRWLAAHDADLLEAEARSGLYGTAAQSRLLERARALRGDLYAARNRFIAESAAAYPDVDPQEAEELVKEVREGR